MNNLVTQYTRNIIGNEVLEHVSTQVNGILWDEIRMDVAWVINMEHIIAEVREELYDE